MTEKARLYADLPGGHSEGYDDTFKQVFRRFYRTVEDRSAPVEYAQFIDGLARYALVEKVLESSAKQAWVDVPDYEVGNRGAIGRSVFPGLTEGERGSWHSGGRASRGFNPFLFERLRDLELIPVGSGSRTAATPRALGERFGDVACFARCCS